MWLWRSPTVQCFYCNTALELVPPQPASSDRKGKRRAVEGRDGAVAVGARDDFWCGVCGQFTRKDKNGDIVSRDAAFYDSSLNDESFSKRGSPSRTRIPSSFPTPQTTPFCRQCLNNQSLQLHLLASYPSSDDKQDPSDPYPPIDEYRRSLDARYPLVCAACAPSVECVIKGRDYRVKTQALGARLRESQLKREREERLSRQVRRRDGLKWTAEKWAWRARGLAWAGTHGGTVAVCCGSLLRRVHSTAQTVQLYLARRYNAVLLLAVFSLLWSCWDPTWSTLRKERARGRNPVVLGRVTYIAIQLAAYVFRIGVLLVLGLDGHGHESALWFLTLVSLIALLSAFYIPTIRHPPPILLSSRSSGTATPTSALASRPADPLEPLAHLSLSRKGSLLAPSPPTTPTGARSPVGGASASEGSGGCLRNRKSSGHANGIRPRVPSFSLRPWRVGPTSATHAMDVDAAGSAATGEAADEANENSMDWTATPPPASIPFSLMFPRPCSPFGTPTPTANAGNHVTFARQRFVPPDLRKPTGLEGMFERVAVKEDEEQSAKAGSDIEMKDAGGRSGWMGSWFGG